ncbi:hypothetical protein ACWDSJ_06605 [Nocardia sp. NPDC003482]
MSRRRWGRWVLGPCVVALTATGCIGAVDRADFEQVVRARGGGLVAALPAGAVTALADRLGVADPEATVILLTAPESERFEIAMIDQPAHVTRFLGDGAGLASRNTTARLRIRDPRRSDQLDDYTYTLGALGEPTPVRVYAGDLTDTAFAIGEVSALTRLEELVDTSVTRSGLERASASAVLVHRSGANVLVTVNVTAPRGAAIAQFDATGTFLRSQRI